MAAFLRLLSELRPPAGERRWLYVPYDQLSASIGPLAREPASELGIVIVESRWKARRRAYHKHKLALLLANQRHFALEQARRGVAVHFVAGDAPFGDLLREVARERGPLRVMEPAERELRVDLAPLVDDGLLEVLPHEGWLTTREQFEESQPDGPPFRMERFYRHVRRSTGLLMDGDAPLGGKFSFDAENRSPWRGEPPAPEPPRFRPDEVTREVLDLVRERFADHPGELDTAHLPATRRDARRLWRWARDACLPRFGPYEDAMSERSRSLFHTRLAPLLNLHRVTPREVLDETLALDLPLASREGFVRQLIGWREFVRHVHAATDGFRTVPTSFLDSADPLPPAYWGKPSGLRCLDQVVAQVWSEGYTHHIPRLMVLANLATLLDVSPRELTDWFWVAFADAYDWVVEPNVLGMGTFAAGDVMTTKPYVCGAAYLNRMGDFCAGCRFDPRGDCPITSLYWDFLERKREQLVGNHRMRIPLTSAGRRDPERRERDAEVARRTRAALARGEELRP